MTPSQRCSGTVDGLSQTVSGVTPLSSTPETNDPRGYSDPPSVIEVHPRGEPLPGQSPMTLSQRCAGTKEWIPNPFCGGTSLQSMPSDPGGPMAMEESYPESTGATSSGALDQESRVPCSSWHHRAGCGHTDFASPPFNPFASFRLHPRPRSRLSHARRIRQQGEL